MAETNITDICATCAGVNGVHVAGCSEAPVDEARLKDRRLSDATRMALTVARIEQALAATPMNICLAALATVVGKAMHGFQPDYYKRMGNLQTFVQAVGKAIEMEVAAANGKAAREGGTPKGNTQERLN